ncbi:MAG TPA: DUF1559 domain-containing protein, partial [Gemmataceae bacterium]
MTPRLYLALSALAALGAVPARAADAPELKLVPGDALAFAHVRLAEIWSGPAMKEVREIIRKAGPEAIRAFDERFVPHPSTLERLTLIVLHPAGKGPGGGEPVPLLVLSTTGPIEREAFLRSLGEPAREVRAGDATVYAVRDTALHFADDRTLLFGPREGVEPFLQKPRSSEGPLAPAVELARSKPVVLAVNAAALPPQVLRDVPPPFRPLLKAKLATLSLDFEKGTVVDLRLRYADDKEAQAAEQSARWGIEMARQALAQAKRELGQRVRGRPGREDPSPLEELPEAAGALFGLGMMNYYEEFLGKLPLQQQGAELAMTVNVPEGPFTSAAAVSGVAVGLLLPAVQKVREAAARAQSQNNLKQIGLAMHNYHDTHGTFPAAAITDKQGRPLLSWRVAILPYLDQNNLYQQFKLDEPWDSEHNKKLLEKMPEIYAPVRGKAPQPHSTYYQVFTGPGTPFAGPKGLHFREFKDGLSNTLLVVEAGVAVPWTKPQDIPYD